MCTVQDYSLPGLCLTFYLLQACKTASTLFSRATAYLSSDTKMNGMYVCVRMCVYVCVMCVCLYVLVHGFRAIHTCMYIQYCHCPNATDCTELLHKCLALREQVLYRFNTDLAETHDCLAQAYSRMGEQQLLLTYA